MFPSGGLLTENIGRDPLNLFTAYRGTAATQTAGCELRDV